MSVASARSVVWFVVLQVHLKSRFIMNGVCVVWKGWIDCTRLDGTGCLEFDEEKSSVRND